MTAFLLFNHVLNFMAPAALVAVLLVLWSRIFGAFSTSNRASAFSVIARTAIVFTVNLTVLGAGVLLFGHDGKMATYAAMVLAASGTLWVLQRR